MRWLGAVGVVLVAGSAGLVRAQACSITPEQTQLQLTSPAFFANENELGVAETMVEARPASAGCQIDSQDQTNRIPLLFRTRFRDNAMSVLQAQAFDSGVTGACEEAIRAGVDCVLIGTLGLEGPAAGGVPPSQERIRRTVIATLRVRFNGERQQ